MALQEHNLVKEGKAGWKNLLARSVCFISLVKLAEHILPTGNYADLLPHFPGLDSSSSCVIPAGKDKVILQYEVCAVYEGASSNNLTNVYNTIPCKRHKVLSPLYRCEHQGNLVTVLKGNYVELAALNSCNLSYFLTVDHSSYGHVL